MKQRLKNVLPHINIILGVVFLILTILDWYNPTKGFLTNQISVVLFIAFCMSSIANAIMMI